MLCKLQLMMTDLCKKLVTLISDCFGILVMVMMLSVM